MAQRRTLIKLWSGMILFVLAASSAPSAGVAAQAPDEDWRTLTTEHFRVTFPAGLETVGRRSAALAEEAYDALEAEFLEAPTGAIDLLVTDHADVSNGLAHVTPSNRIVVYARPPVDGLSLGYLDDWLELVIIHELAHIVHLDHTGTALGKLGRAVLGRPPAEWPVFPGLATPRWLIEGLATWYESDLTTAGRVHGTFLEMQLRTAVLEGRFEGIGEASGSSPLWPGGNRPYAYGSMFFDHLLDRYGEDRMTDFAEAVAGQWVPYRLDAAGRSAFGVSLSDAWRAWSEDLEARYRDLDARLARNGPVTEPERLTSGARWAFHPSVSPDGRRLVYTRSDGRSDIQLEVQDPPGSVPRALGRTNGLATYSWTEDGRILLAQLEFADPYRVYGDLYFMGPDGDLERLTEGARITEPSVAPDGTWAVAVQQGGGTNGLVRVDLSSGESSELVAPDPEVVWAFPRVSPDGRWIAATRWEPAAYHDVVIMPSDGNGPMTLVTYDRAMDLAPAWSPDGRWIVWSSDRTGVMNILGVEIDPATGATASPVLLTNVRTGAAFPSVGPNGAWLYFSGHHVDGWEAERVRFEPRTRPAAPAPAERFEAPPELSVSRELAAGPIAGYSPLPTLLPTYWEPRYREPVVAPASIGGGVSLRSRELLSFGLGAETSMTDLVGRHTYGAFAHVFTSRRKWEGGLAYSYRGLGNPVFTVNAEQTWGAAGQRLAGAAPDTLLVLERERSVDASVTLFSTRWRRNLAITLGGGLVWENRELLRGNDLRPSVIYALSSPRSRLSELRASLSYVTSRTHSFQTGAARGFSAFVQGRTRQHPSLPDSLAGEVGADRSFEEVISRVRGYVPLWRGGHATHVLAVQAAGGAASGPGAAFGHFGVGGASGSPEPLSGLSLFGGGFVLLPVRGFPRSTRAGRYAWASSAEYRFPIALLNRGLGPWPLHFDRVIGSLFFDVGNAWDPNPRGTPLSSVGAEVTLQLLGLYDTNMLLRTGVAFLVGSGSGSTLYVRVGLPF